MNKNVIFAWVMLTFMLSINSAAIAQCSMCKATIKENVEKGEGVGNGINKGILYLMAIPYIAGGTIAYLWYRSSKKNKVNPN
ncbi:MAG: hypothetical protein ACK40G_05720 [Cytophagaceae bacterium]